MTFIYRTSCDGQNLAAAIQLSLGVVNKAHRWTDLDVYWSHATSHIATVAIEFHETVHKISAYISRGEAVNDELSLKRLSVYMCAR